MNEANEFDIAIIGMAARFPGAPTLEKFWQNLIAGVDSMTRFSNEELQSAGVPPSWIKDSRYVKASPILEDPGAFDAEFFRFSPMEAKTLDPQHRILLELAHEAVEDAGYDPTRCAGRIGVFTGAALNSYFFDRQLQSQLAEEYIPTLIGADKDFLSTRIAYKLNLKGPSITVQTACSTSMVAVHLARQSLLSNETDMVLAGGISVRVPHRVGYFYDGGGVVSPDGQVRAFDAKANGTVFGSGGGIIVLKRLSDAISDRDNIYAVIKGSAVNNDGSEKAGYTAPSVNGQADAVIEALSNAGVGADSISYIEAHGSGTPVGDPIEINALTKAFRTSTQRSGFCAIGSVKTNVGHLDAAAAVAGIIKTVLCLKNRQIPPSLNFTEPNPEIDFANTPFFVNSELRKWTSSGPRRAGVMSTGMGGTNAHLILEEAPELPDPNNLPGPDLLLLSAKTEAALDQSTDRLREFLSRNPAINMRDVTHTLKVGRKAFAYRRYAVCNSREDAVAFLKLGSPELFSSYRPSDSPRPTILLLPGVGDHYVGMSHGLYKASKVFREEVDRCALVLESHLDADIREILFPKGGSWEKETSKKGIDFKKLIRRNTEEPEDLATEKLNETLFVQPALFTVEYALARLWQSMGVTITAMVGHSMGEYVAACLAGVLSLEDALQLIVTRARLVSELPQGRMLAVLLSESELLPWLSGGLSIALINNPDLCVVAGPTVEINDLEERLRASETVSRPVRNSHPFHSRMLDPIVKTFEAEVRKVQLREPKISYISNVTGKWITPEEATSPAYWAMHLNHPARFADALTEVSHIKDPILIEAGPGRTLGVLATQYFSRSKMGHLTTISSLRHLYENQSDIEFLSHSLGQLWLAGAEIKWEQTPQFGGRRISLPTYPWQRKNYWLNADSHAEKDSGSRSKIAHSPRVDDWFYQPTWERTAPLSNARNIASQQAMWLVFSDRDGEGSCFQAKLEMLRTRALFVRLGDRFVHSGSNVVELDAANSGDYLRLFSEIKAREPQALNILHLGSFSRNEEPTNVSAAQLSQKFGFYSLLYLAQAISEVDLSVPVKIGIISTGVHQVTGAEALDPAKATVLGPCGVIPKEFSNISCFNVDLSEDTRTLDQLPSQWLTAILSEFDDPSRSRIVAYRGPYRWERRYRQIQLPAGPVSNKADATATTLKCGGVYLITGGTGGIGLEVAQYLAATYRAKLVLTKRSPFPEKSSWRQLHRAGTAPKTVLRTIGKLLEAEEKGAQIEVMAADVSNREAMKKVLEQTVKKFGGLQGVIHAAGLVNPGGMVTKTKEVADSVLSPKVSGTLVLFDLLKKTNIEFLVLFSSINSILAPHALCDYAAANAFLDAFANFCNTQEKFRTLAINWPGWKEVGILTELKPLLGMERWKQNILDRAITTAEGLEVFRRAINADLPQLIASPEKFNDLLCNAEACKPESYVLSSVAELPAPSTNISHELPKPVDEIERTLTQIWSNVFGIDHIGAHDNFFEIGGHSLLAARVVAQVQRSLGKRISIASIFRAPTIAQLALTVRGATAPHVVPFDSQRGGQSRLLWFGGGAIFYPLAKCLESNPFMVSITLPDDNLGSFRPPYRLEELARSMADKIHEIEPIGPYFLGGWCLEGLLAYETGRQLQLQGREVGLVVLVDTPVSIHRPASSFRERLLRRVKRELFHLSRLRSMSGEQRGKYIRGRLEWLKVILQRRKWKETSGENEGILPQEQLFEELLFLSALDYKPSSYSGRVLFLQPQVRPTDPYWDLAVDWRTLAGSFEEFEAPGDHTSMFHQPHVRILAERIRKSVNEFQSIQGRRKPVSGQSIDDARKTFLS